jgi:hypothetical protein
MTILSEGQAGETFKQAILFSDIGEHWAECNVTMFL